VQVRGWSEVRGRRAAPATLVVAVVTASLLASGHPLRTATATPSEVVPAASPTVPADREGDTPEEVEPSPEELAYEAAVEALRVAVRDQRAARAAHRETAGNVAAADRALREGEEAIVDALLEQRVAELEVEAAERALRATEHRIRRVTERLGSLQDRADALADELELARVELERRIVRAYKTGSPAYESSIALAIVREVDSPSELATALKHLSTLMAVGLEQVDELVDELSSVAQATARGEAQLASAQRDRDAAVEELAEAAAALPPLEEAAGAREEDATALRSAAYDAEAALLTAVSTLREQREALDEARTIAEEAAEEASTSLPRIEGLPPASTAAATDPFAAPTWQRRQQALDRARSLPAEDRRTAEDWICPVPDARFVNDWGFPRSSNRRHEGTDVFAPLGTPVLAPTDAVVSRLDEVDRYDGRRGLGGITVNLERDRHRYYLAHLDAIHPDLQVGDEVAAGTVVGWVGRTGNARGTPPHLHLGWYVDGVAVNAYPSLAVVCRSEGS
jgi:peptidoglycan LD-endopeptidase LytH